MTEPVVTLTDYALAVEAAVFFCILRRDADGDRKLRYWLCAFFASASVAAFCGGTVHGFFHEPSVGQTMWWTATLLATGVSALATWAIGAELLASRQVARWIIVAAGVQFVIYAAVVLFYTDAFWVVIAINLPAVLFLLVALAANYRRTRNRAALIMASGLGLSIVAAVLQQLKFGLHAIYFDHNAFYHLLQAIVLFLIFQGGRQLCCNSGECHGVAA